MRIGNSISIFQKSLILFQALFYIGEMPWKSLQLSLSNSSSIQSKFFQWEGPWDVWSSFPGGQPAAQPVPAWAGPVSTSSRNSSHVLVEPGLSLGGCRKREILQRQEVQPQLLWASFAEGLPTRAELGSAVLLPVLSISRLPSA